MAKFNCPDCGFVHNCKEDETPEKESEEGGKSTQKGYSIYWVPCHCGCGCGHHCDLIYGPYAKIHNQAGRDAINGPAGEQLKVMRAANAKIRREHLREVHSGKT